MSSAKNRIGEIDFVKCVLIVLMVAFHIVYIGDKYPRAKALEETFIMPVFFVLSGYMARTDKPVREQLRAMVWLFVPYAVMEVAYVLMASVLPIRDHVDVLTPAVLLDKVLLHPIGPYWFLHRLLECHIFYYIVFRFVRGTDFTRFIVLGLLFYAGSLWPFVPSSVFTALYFMAGAVVRRSGVAFLSVFRSSGLALLPLAVLVSYDENLYLSTSGGVLITYLVVCLLLFVYRYVRGRVLRGALFIGRNTLLVLLFSPMFTAAARLYQPLLTGIDPSGMVFMTVTVVIALAGCLAIGWVMDRLNVSRLMFGRHRVLA